jgi:hypothetical protein
MSPSIWQRALVHRAEATVLMKGERGFSALGKNPLPDLQAKRKGAKEGGAGISDRSWTQMNFN